ncbi:MAG: hypothetical protein ABI481_11235 [Pyrinomonadaceae bacterium]
MYCERCGKQIDESLNYCNACGTQLRRENSPPQKSLTAFMIAALAFTTILGLIVLAGFVITLIDRVKNPEPVFVFAIAYLAVLFGICFMIMRQVSKLIDADLPSRELPHRNIVVAESASAAFYKPARRISRTRERDRSDDANP